MARPYAAPCSDTPCVSSARSAVGPAFKPREGEQTGMARHNSESPAYT